MFSSGVNYYVALTCFLMGLWHYEMGLWHYVSAVAAVSVTASAAAAARALDSDLAAARTVRATWGAAGATYQCPGPCMPHTSSVVPAVVAALRMGLAVPAAAAPAARAPLPEAAPAAAAAALRVGLAVPAAAAEPPNPAVAVLAGAAKCVQSDVLPHIKPPKYRYGHDLSVLVLAEWQLR